MKNVFRNGYIATFHLYVVSFLKCCSASPLIPVCRSSHFLSHIGNTDSELLHTWLVVKYLVCGILQYYCQAFPFISVSVSSVHWEFVTNAIFWTSYIKIISFFIKLEHLEDSELVSCSVGGLASRKKLWESQMVAAGNTITFGCVPKFQRVCFFNC